MSAAGSGRAFVVALTLALLVSVGVPALGEGTEAGLFPCLAVAADGSPVYPATTMPSGKSLTVVFHLDPDASAKELNSKWVSLDSNNEVIAEHTLDLKGQKTGWLRLVLKQAAPAGKYRLETSLDGKPWKSADITVVPVPDKGAAETPADLVPMEENSVLNYDMVTTPGPDTKIDMGSVQPGTDGKYRATLTITVGKADTAGTYYRGSINGQTTGEMWVKLDDAGLVAVRRKDGEQVVDVKPPRIIQPMPPKLEDGIEWTAPGDEGSEIKLKLFGPLSVEGPSGPATGYVIFGDEQFTIGKPGVPAQHGRQTVERHYIPKVGLVSETRISMLDERLQSRMEVKLSPAIAYRIVADPQMKGRLGRVKFAFPADTKTADVRVAVFKPGAAAKDKPVANGYGGAQFELLPGKYEVAISGKRVPVEVKSASDTIPCCGVLRVHAGSNTRFRILDADQKTELHNAYGQQDVGLPVGDYFIEISGTTEPVKIVEGQVVEF